MAIQRNRSNSGFTRPQQVVTPRPAPVVIPKAVKQAFSAGEAKMCDFGAGGAYVEIVRGQVLGVPVSGADLGRNGPETPRFISADTETWLRSMGLLELKSKAESNTSHNGEAYTVRYFVKAE